MYPTYVTRLGGTTYELIIIMIRTYTDKHINKRKHKYVYKNTSTIYSISLNENIQSTPFSKCELASADIFLV